MEVLPITRKNIHETPETEFSVDSNLNFTI